MAHTTTIAEARPVRSRLVRPIAAVFAALAAASAATTFVAGPEFPASPSGGSKDQDWLFDARFPPVSAERPPPSASEIELSIAKGLLAQKLSDIELERPALETMLETTPAVGVLVVPLPRSRPAEADLPRRDHETAALEDQTLFQRLAGLFRPRMTMASLTPDDGISSGAPDLAALGYDGPTAVYDISARAVYMPNGSRLEAHSGFGDTKDDPRHVSDQNVGPTPPAVYELKLRERPFHGVQALRMIPVEGNTTRRSGILAHGYMLGPEGDSNGCVSIKDYDKFLAAFRRGDITRLVVILSTAELVRRSVL
jgi:hypothetical protein